MTKFVLSRPGAPWDYPTLGFIATADGAILDGTLFTPDLTIPPDAFWSVYGGGSAETSITRYATPSEDYLDPTPEVTDGWFLAYDTEENTYTPRDPAELIETGAWSSALSASIAYPGDVTGITRDGSGRITGYTEGSVVVSDITYDSGLVESFDVNGDTKTITRDGSNRVTGVS